jgi:hypothetical protein
MESSRAAAPPDEVQEEDRPWLILAYCGPLALLPLTSRSVAKHVKFHARQGLGLFILFCGLSLIALMPWIGPALWFVGALIYLGVTIGGLFYAFKGLRLRIPYASSPIDLISRRLPKKTDAGPRGPTPAR